jgi:hypothetical protein
MVFRIFNLLCLKLLCWHIIPCKVLLCSYEEVDESSKQYYSLMITAMDPIEDESASADGDFEEENNHNESPSLESCDSDSECESKNNHKGRHEDEDQDLQPIIEGYNGTEIWDDDDTPQVPYPHID